jgi:hypothetical protein
MHKNRIGIFWGQKMVIRLMGGFGILCVFMGCKGLKPLFPQKQPVFRCCGAGKGKFRLGGPLLPVLTPV